MCIVFVCVQFISKLKVTLVLQRRRKNAKRKMRPQMARLPNPNRSLHPLQQHRKSKLP